MEWVYDAEGERMAAEALDDGYCPVCMYELDHGKCAVCRENMEDLAATPNQETE